MSNRPGMPVYPTDWSESQAETIGLIAVASTEADRSLLIHAFPESKHSAAFETIAKALESGLLKETQKGGWAFTTPEARELALARIGAREKTSLHLTIANAIEKRDGSITRQNVQSLADHYLQALPLVTVAHAATYSLRAGEVLFDQKEFQAARLVLESGLQLVGRSEPSKLKADLLFTLGRVLLATSDIWDIRAAVTTLESAVEAYVRIGDLDSAFAVAGLPVPAIHGKETTVRMLERAVSHSETHVEDAVKISIRLARAHLLERGNGPASRATLDRAIELARSSGRRDLELRAIAARALNSIYALDTVAAERDAQRVFRGSTADSQRLAELDACEAMYCVEMLRGNQERMYELGQRMIAAADWTGSYSHTALGHMICARVRMNEAMFDSAVSHFQTAHELQPRWPVPISLLSLIAYRTGDDLECHRWLDILLRAAPTPDRDHTAGYAIGFSQSAVWANSFLYLDELTGDKKLLDRARLLVEPPVLGTGMPYQQMAAMEPWAEIAVRDYDVETAQMLDAEYQAMCGESPPWIFASSCASIAFVAGDRRRSARIFRNLLRFCQHHGLKMMLIACVEAYVGIHSDGNRRPRPVVAAARLAKEVADQNGIVRLREPIHRILKNTRSTFAKPPQLALTVREKQVVSLISQGRSNRQIAQELVISPYTVDSHVRNLLIKLGVSTRAEAAQIWARIGSVSDH